MGVEFGTSIKIYSCPIVADPKLTPTLIAFFFFKTSPSHCGEMGNYMVITLSSNDSFTSQVKNRKTTSKNRVLGRRSQTSMAVAKEKLTIVVCCTLSAGNKTF